MVALPKLLKVKATRPFATKTTLGLGNKVVAPSKSIQQNSFPTKTSLGFGNKIGLPSKQPQIQAAKWFHQKNYIRFRQQDGLAIKTTLDGSAAKTTLDVGNQTVALPKLWIKTTRWFCHQNYFRFSSKTFCCQNAIRFWQQDSCATKTNLRWCHYQNYLRFRHQMAAPLKLLQVQATRRLYHQKLPQIKGYSFPTKTSLSFGNKTGLLQKLPQIQATRVLRYQNYFKYRQQNSFATKTTEGLGNKT